MFLHQSTQRELVKSKPKMANLQEFINLLVSRVWKM